MNPKPKKTSDETPHGREAIKEAILDAAEELLSKKNPNEVTVRKIAEAAGINHSLVHRHFGTKENVVVAVHERIIEKMDMSATDVEQIKGNVNLFFKMSQQNVSRRVILTRAMLNGVSPHLIQHHFPVMRRLLDLAKKKKASAENPSKYDPEILTAVFTATVMGWFLYEPFFLASLEMEDWDKEEIYSQMIELLEEMVEKFS